MLWRGLDWAGIFLSQLGACEKLDFSKSLKNSQKSENRKKSAHRGKKGLRGSGVIRKSPFTGAAEAVAGTPDGAEMVDEADEN